MKKINITIAILSLFVFFACEESEVFDKTRYQNSESDYNLKAYDVESSYIDFIKVEVPQIPTDRRGFVLTKQSKVYILQSEGLKEYRTLKIRDLSWRYPQEWLLDDLCTNGIPDYTYFPGDPTGNIHGYYYPWYQIQTIVDNNQWQFITFRDSAGTIPINGDQFHLPKIDSYVPAFDGDIEKLTWMLGSTSLIPNILCMEYDGTSGSFYQNKAYIWLEARGSYEEGSIYPGCGYMGMWDNIDNNSFWHCHTNNPNLKVNVRLVRNITQAEW